MIDREEAYSKARKLGISEFSLQSLNAIDLVTEIYDSIGNCGSCKHMVKPTLNNRGDIQFPQYCKLTQAHHKDDFFCADFDKKEKQ